MTKVYITQAEHWNIPGRHITVHRTKDGAIHAAVVRVNQMLKDSDLEPNTNATTWEDDLAEVQAIHGARFCDVWIDEQELLT